MTMSHNMGIERLRGYSSVFSRNAFTDILLYDDFSRLDYFYHRYDSGQDRIQTYGDYLKYIYRAISKGYRCEYVYKNEIINNLLLKRYGTRNTIALNEFRVCRSIVDFALFNGESKAFEIKTEYDNKSRLDHQLKDYSKIFQKCYIVIPEKLYNEYNDSVNNNIGIIVLVRENGGLKMDERKEAKINNRIDSDVLMHSLRTIEYQNIVKTHFGAVPDVSCFEMFDKCRELIKQIPQPELHELFLEEIKKRTSNTSLLRSLPSEIRQICLAMNLNQKKTEMLLEKLNNKIVM